MSLYNSFWQMLIPNKSGPVYPAGCLTFESTLGSSGAFSIKFSARYWNGTLQYSKDAETWTTIGNGYGKAINSENGRLYLRGTSITRFATSSSNVTTISLTATNGKIKCIGDIETILDYQTVLNGNHPTMDTYCFYKLFLGATDLVSSPSLPAETLTTNCYGYMFQNCANLATPPKLPATTLAYGCYAYMFAGCTGLEAIPAIPYPCGITAYLNGPYVCMFQNCTQLVFSTVQASGASYYYTGEAVNRNIFQGTDGGNFGNVTVGTDYYTTTPILS